MKKEFPHLKLKKWFWENQRPLPWREERTPYRVWISEVMLQQTQAAVVIPYYARWMELYPTLEKLAEAPLDEIIKVWEGLGYYERARNLHRAAQILVRDHEGIIPDDQTKLAEIKGLGSYTQAAILSFAFHQKKAPVDGNVVRVLSRFFAIEDTIDTVATKRKIQTIADSILPDEEPWFFSEGLIELGALICQKDPKCLVCPLNTDCAAFQMGKQHALPKKKKRPLTTLLSRDVAVVHCREHFLLQRRNHGEIMEGLYEFPYWESGAHCKEHFEKALGFSLKYQYALPKQIHSFTRYRVTLYPHFFETDQMIPSHLWFHREELTRLPFSSGHRRIVPTLFKEPISLAQREKR